MTKGDLAKQYFLQGNNCSNSVLLSFKDEMKMDESVVRKLGIGFGGGFARQRLVCGCVSGMTMVLSYLLSDGEDRTEIYGIIRSACEEFKSQVGSLICAELLEGVSVTKGGVPEERTIGYYKKRPCAELCEIAADITAKYLEKYSK